MRAAILSPRSACKRLLELFQRCRHVGNVPAWRFVCDAEVRCSPEGKEEGLPSRAPATPFASLWKSRRERRCRSFQRGGLAHVAWRALCRGACTDHAGPKPCRSGGSRGARPGRRRCRDGPVCGSVVGRHAGAQLPSSGAGEGRGPDCGPRGGEPGGATAEEGRRRGRRRPKGRHVRCRVARTTHDHATSPLFADGPRGVLLLYRLGRTPLSPCEASFLDGELRRLATGRGDPHRGGAVGLGVWRVAGRVAWRVIVARGWGGLRDRWRR